MCVNFCQCSSHGLCIRKFCRSYVFRRLLGSAVPPGCRLSSTVSSFELLSREFFYPDYLHMKALNYALTCTHDLFQMPWTWTIVGTAFFIRTLVNSPFYFYSEKNLAKVLHISLDCARTSPMLLKKLESSASYKQLDPSAARNYFKKMSRRVFLKTCEGNHCHPFKSAAAAVIQIPFWLSFSFTLRYMCGFQLAPDYGECRFERASSWTFSHFWAVYRFPNSSDSQFSICCLVVLRTCLRQTPISKLLFLAALIIMVNGFCAILTLRLWGANSMLSF
ncbi:hypothetical protein FGIG_12195 [Fasciola gigantica]|uniref:Uncharacterized protein n=1 Tax=Fasciola gigantica TaxID=46835 RepID=A0A504YS01_FASGI|nr:hypothetical protein FGIG_12195 [Fasciola gigantica]